MSHRDRIASDLRAAGLLPGSVVLVHSSLSSLGKVDGGTHTVIQALKDALGPEGTLLMPALSYATVNSANPRFDVRTTPSCVGTIPEAFRLMPGVIRSVHPTHSVCGVGPRAEALLAGHEEDNTPVGPHSPFRKLPECGGLILMLGCGLKPNTSMHGVEELVRPPFLFGEEFTISVRRQDGTETAKMYRRHGFVPNGYVQRYDRVAALGSGPWLRTAKVMDATVHLIDAAELWRRAHEKLAADHFYFVDKAGGRP